MVAMNAVATITAQRGRPTSYNTDIAAKICEAVARSDKGLRKTLESDPELPAFGCVQAWLQRHADFASAYSHAKRLQLEAMAEDIVDISDDDSIDPADKRLMVDTRKWLLSKLVPKTYGDKLDLTSGGEALPASSVSIDQRIQSIMMSAEARRRGALVALSDEAASLLE